MRVDDSYCRVCGGERFGGVRYPYQDDADEEPDDDYEGEYDGGPSLADLPYVGDEIADRMRDAGYASVADVAAADPDDLAAVHGVGAYRAEDMVAAAAEYEE